MSVFSCALQKLAEPPPPKGVSVRDWDERLAKGPGATATAVAGEAKTAKVLSMQGREHIKSKNFAIPKGNGPGDTGKYPIHDAAHARNALTRVEQFGSSSEKSKVHSAVAKKYPGLAARSSVEDVQEKAKKAEAPVALIRKLARERGKLAFDSLTGGAEPSPSVYELIYGEKVASATNPELLRFAIKTADTVERGFELYEAMGGEFDKTAFGAPMFPSGGAPTGSLGRSSNGRATTAGTAPAAPGGGLSKPTLPNPASGAPGTSGGP